MHRRHEANGDDLHHFPGVVNALDLRADDWKWLIDDAEHLRIHNRWSRSQGSGKVVSQQVRAHVMARSGL